MLGLVNYQQYGLITQRRLHNIVEVDEVVVENLEIENLEAVVSCQPGDTAKGYSNNEKSNLDVVEDPFDDDDDDSGQSIWPPGDSSSESEDKEHSSPRTKRRNNAGVHTQPPRDIEASSSTISSTSSDEEWDVNEEDLFDVDHDNQQTCVEVETVYSEEGCIGDGSDAVGIGDSGYEDALLDKAVLTAYYGVVRVVVLVWRYCREGRWYAL